MLGSMVIVVCSTKQCHDLIVHDKGKTWDLLITNQATNYPVLYVLIITKCQVLCECHAVSLFWKDWKKVAGNNIATFILQYQKLQTSLCKKRIGSWILLQTSLLLKCFSFMALLCRLFFINQWRIFRLLYCIRPPKAMVKMAVLVYLYVCWLTHIMCQVVACLLLILWKGERIG